MIRILFYLVRNVSVRAPFVRSRSMCVRAKRSSYSYYDEIEGMLDSIAC